MKLPRLFNNEKEAHFVLALLCAANSLLIIVLFLIVFPGSKNLLPKITPISAQTPIVNFNLTTPRPNSTVAGTVPLQTTLTNGPKIVSEQLIVDGETVQQVTSQRTDRLTLYWDTTKFSNGSHTVKIKARHDNSGDSQITVNLIVQNNATRQTK